MLKFDYSYLIFFLLPNYQLLLMLLLSQFMNIDAY